MSTLVTSTGALGVDATLAACMLGGLAGAYDLGLTNAAGAAIALSVGNNGDDTTFGGALTGAGSLTKVGDGTLTLTGANAYAGATTIEAGTLALGADGALPAGSAVVFNGGALASGSFTNTLGAVSVETLGGTLAMGDGSGTLAFANSSGQTWSGALNVTFTGTWNPAALRFGTNASGLSAAQLQSLRLNGERAWFQLDAQGYLWKMTGTLLRVR